MNDLALIHAFFSPTGGTMKASRAVCEGCGRPVREIDLSAPVTEEAIPVDAVLLAAVPVFGGRVPALALERLAALKGNGGKAVALVVYGNRAYDDALLELKDALEANGFHVTAAGAFVAQHSMAASIAAGRPDEDDLTAARDFGRAVMEKLNGPAADAAQIPGKSPYQDFPGLPPVSAGKKCQKCGACAVACPTGAIDLEDPSKTDKSKCITCMRCVSLCPHGARNLPAPMRLAVNGMLKMKASSRRQPEVFL